ncbi:serine hydrolase domain-containing protein [Flavobacterium sp. TAB 87]|uniref:serine hydrolase n=1 Tax=Flavobacterium sp. TAB 87 TaxID=1729581 RepID=UPI00076C8A9B|nr:serine hydrolase domain-containing protein [Flavobacterium sp. TAB 87]KVV13424.1 FmtA-like protein [Flavobacterium sp. TAB 87]
MKSLSQIISIIFLSLSSTITFAQKQKDYSTKIDSLVNTTSPRIFNGVIFATKNGKEIYSKVYGYSNFDSKVPLQLNSTFKIMSNSKQITAVLLLKQVEKGTVNLQAPIKKYLPY